MIIGITGITGSGTSTAAKILESLGGNIISADKLAHEAIKKGQPAYKKILEFFTEDILDTQGEISRKALGKIVFNDPSKRKILESIIHPIVIQEIKNHVNRRGEHCSLAARFTVIDAPLLFESGLDKLCDICWIIEADNEARIARIIKRDNITREVACARIAARGKLPDAIIIKNTGTFEELEQKIKESLRAIFE